MRPTRSVLVGILAFAAFGLGAPSAGAYVTLPGGVTPSETPPSSGGLVKLSNGEYGLYGTGAGAGAVLKVYDETDEKALLKRATGLEVTSGATGQDAGSVSGMSSADTAAAESMHGALVSDGTSGGAEGVMGEVTSGSRALGVLPTLGEVASALSGVTELVGVGVLGVAIGTEIDEVLGLPTLFEGESSGEGGTPYFSFEWVPGPEKYSQTKLCAAAIPGHEPDVWRANADHCELVNEMVTRFWVPTEACLPRYGPVTCKVQGEPSNVASVFGTGEESWHHAANLPNDEPLTNGDQAIFRDVEQEFTDAAMPVSGGRSYDKDIELPAGKTPEVAAPEPLTTPIAPLGKSEVPGELQTFLAAGSPELGHAEGAVPDPTAVGKLAEALAEQNPGTSMSKEELKLAAGQCVEMTMSAGYKGTEKCETLPIFMSGSDVASATEHDLDALKTEPKWVRLNYNSVYEKKVEEEEPRKWYEGLEGCEGSNPPEESCDEYPFYATDQGGEGAVPKPSIRFINHEDNVTQGGKYGNFVTACKMATRSASGYAFLAVPLPPALGIPTTRLCN